MEYLVIRDLIAVFNHDCSSFINDSNQVLCEEICFKDIWEKLQTLRRIYSKCWLESQNWWPKQELRNSANLTERADSKLSSQRQ